MIEPPFRALLVAAIGRAMLTEAGLPAADQATVALSAVTVGAQKEYRSAFAAMAEALP
ncbi:MAG TPA: hypothetical protein VKE93_15980 [Candidatus Angelobacter sp.]|nr:hypothetical protein [Candidatus Angelobacter sp.]